ICFLDTMGKVFETIILNKLKKYTESESGLANTQFGFRKIRSTIDAINMLIERADRARKQKRRGNRFSGIIKIDVRNAFNSATWSAIARALYDMKVPSYLYRILKSYFENRILIYDTAEGKKVVSVTAGVPQGSIFGPTLWNIMYNGVLSWHCHEE